MQNNLFNISDNQLHQLREDDMLSIELAYKNDSTVMTLLTTIAELRKDLIEAVETAKTDSDTQWETIVAERDEENETLSNDLQAMEDDFEAIEKQNINISNLLNGKTYDTMTKEELIALLKQVETELE